jgi:hypothetical protein
LTTDTVRVVPSRHEWLELLDRFGAAALAGIGTGFVIGGVGGRLAMFLLRLTSPDSLHGLATDDDFTIGEFSTDTIFLLLLTTLAGTLLAYAYLLVRRWLPERRRPLQSAVFFGLVGGALIVDPEGVDFTLLEPPALAIALFVVLPAAYGWVMAALIEHLIANPGRLRRTRVAAIVLFVAVGFFGLLPIAFAAAGTLLVLIGRRWPALARAVVGPVPTWLVRGALLLGGAVAAVVLVQDSLEIL